MHAHILSLIFTGEGEKRGRETGKKLPEDPKEAGQGISISICYWILLFGVGILKKKALLREAFL